MRFLYLLAMIAGLLGWPAASEQQDDKHSHTTTESIMADTVYVCPMHSHIVRDHAGTCPICGMDLVPQQTQNQSNPSPTVEVSGQIQQAMNIQVQQVGRSDLWKYIETLGVATFDEANVQHIHPRVSGWIEQLAVSTEGQPITKGQLLYTLYSPELVVAQDDYLQLLDSGQSASSVLYQRARRRLTLLGMTQDVIAQLEKNKSSFYSVPFYAQQDGIVSSLAVRPGMYVSPQNSMMTVSDLTRLWVIADVFEKQFDWVRQGRPAEVHFDSIGVHREDAEIDYLYPQLDSTTASLKVRLTLNNSLQRVKPGMQARVIIYGGPKRDVINIPRAALISQGHRNKVVVQTDNHGFEIRDVEVGLQTQGRVEILSGLQEGERLVVSGQFLIDSEASLQGAGQRLAQPHTH